jgi:hypothetical protein
MSELVQSLPKSQWESVFGLLHAHVTHAIQSGAYTDGSDAPLSKQKECLEAMHVLHQIMEACVQLADGKTKTISATLFQSVQLFHGRCQPTQRRRGTN